jgi:hypothetical protein
MVNVVVVKKSNGVINSEVPVTLKNFQVTSGTNRLDKLIDVVATSEVSGATLVYDANTDKYVVQPLDISNVTGDLDGGTF